MNLGLQLPPLADFDLILRDAEAAEAAGFDFVWLPEGMSLSENGTAGRLPFDATLLASAIASRTHRIGILATATPARHEPYNLARRLASLDWISQGRIGWFVDTVEDSAREAEYVGLLRDLWDSWDDDAFIHDKAAGRFFQPDRMHVLDHQGPHFSVRGPLNVNRPPQGHPIIATMADAAIADKADIVLVREGSAPPPGRDAADRPFRRLGGWSEFNLPAGILADHIEGNCDRLGLDGVVLCPSTSSALAEFIIKGIPELGRRGLIGGNLGDHTLRGRLGLPRPALPVLEVSA